MKANPQGEERRRETEGCGGSGREGFENRFAPAGEPLKQRPCVPWSSLGPLSIFHVRFGVGFLGKRHMVQFSEPTVRSTRPSIMDKRRALLRESGGADPLKLPVTRTNRARTPLSRVAQPFARSDCVHSGHTTSNLTRMTVFCPIFPECTKTSDGSSTTFLCSDLDRPYLPRSYIPSLEYLVGQRDHCTATGSQPRLGGLVPTTVNSTKGTAVMTVKKNEKNIHLPAYKMKVIRLRKFPFFYVFDPSSSSRQCKLLKTTEEMNLSSGPSLLTI